MPRAVHTSISRGPSDWVRLSYATSSIFHFGWIQVIARSGSTKYFIYRKQFWYDWPMNIMYIRFTPFSRFFNVCHEFGHFELYARSSVDVIYLVELSRYFCIFVRLSRTWYNISPDTNLNLTLYSHLGLFANSTARLKYITTLGCNILTNTTHLQL